QEAKGGRPTFAFCPLPFAVPMLPPDIDQLRAEFQSSLASSGTLIDLKAVRDRFLSRKHGLVTALVKAIAAAPPETRPVLGAAANALKHEIEEAIDTRELEILAGARPKDAVDVTLQGRVPVVGRRHPLTLVRERVEDIFAAMGYQIIDGPE